MIITKRAVAGALLSGVAALKDNVAQNIFEGATPPPPPPPPPAIISTREQCLAILGPIICPRG